MAVYAYSAFDRQERPARGVVMADSARAARDELRGRGLIVEDLREHIAKPRVFSLLFRRKGLTTQMANMLRELATLLSVGVSLVDAIDILSRQQKGALQTSLLTLKDHISGGSNLADAMKRQDDVYDSLVRHMVRVGEHAGNLDKVLDQIADFKERSLQLKDRIVGAITYPAIVLFTSLVVVVFLMTVVVPMLLTSLLEAGAELPWPTQVLKSLSDLLLVHGMWLGIGVVLSLIVLVFTVRSHRGKLIWDRFLLKVPILGSMIHRQAISRISMVISTLIKSGIEYVDAAKIAAGATRNQHLSQGLERSIALIREGQDIGPALEQSGVFPLVVVHVFSVGQASGKLEEMLDRLAETYDRQVASLATRLTSVLEPILIILLAVFVGFILFATLLPILEAGNVLRK
jgi:type II secretory pathway component PulF